MYKFGTIFKSDSFLSLHPHPFFHCFILPNSLSLSLYPSLLSCLSLTLFFSLSLIFTFTIQPLVIFVPWKIVASNWGQWFSVPENYCLPSNLFLLPNDSPRSLTIEGIELGLKTCTRASSMSMSNQDYSNCSDLINHAMNWIFFQLIMMSIRVQLDYN